MQNDHIFTTHALYLRIHCLEKMFLTTHKIFCIINVSLQKQIEEFQFI